MSKKYFVIVAVHGNILTVDHRKGDHHTFASASEAFSYKRDLSKAGFIARYADDEDLLLKQEEVCIEARIPWPQRELNVRLFLEAGRNSSGPWGHYTLSSGCTKQPMERSASMAPEMGAYEAHAETLFEALSTLEVALTSDQLQRCTLTVAGTGTVNAVLRCAQRGGLKADGKPGQSSDVLAKAGAILKKLKSVSFE